MRRGTVVLHVSRPPSFLDRHEGQTLASMREADALLAQLDEDELTTHGLVLELHLDDVTTLSLGRVTLDDTTVAYHGRQRMTRDNSGHCVYGGSDLTCVRGGWSALEARPLAAAVRTAVRQARVYDDAMSEYGVVASRRNYDIGQGADSSGRARSGVFEASWRVGGATPAEVAALETFARDPSVDVVHASSVEAYGADAAPPDGAVVHFHGVDSDAGPVLRYSLTQRRNLGIGKGLQARGLVCLTFNLRGHARTRAQRDTVTRAQNLADVIAAYDFLASRPEVDATRVGVVGSSYGGYLATLLTAERKVRWLALHAPALYMDGDFDRPKRELNLDPKLAEYRRRRLEPSANRALTAASRFDGDVLVVESEHDPVIPREVVANYLHAFEPAGSRRHEVLADADHGLSREAWRREWGELLVDWVAKRAAPPSSFMLASCVERACGSRADDEIGRAEARRRRAGRAARSRPSAGRRRCGRSRGRL